MKYCKLLGQEIFISAWKECKWIIDGETITHFHSFFLIFNGLREENNLLITIIRSFLRLTWLSWKFIQQQCDHILRYIDFRFATMTLLFSTHSFTFAIPSFYSLFSPQSFCLTVTTTKSAGARERERESRVYT